MLANMEEATVSLLDAIRNPNKTLNFDVPYNQPTYGFPHKGRHFEKQL